MAPRNSSLVKNKAPWSRNIFLSDRGASLPVTHVHGGTTACSTSSRTLGHDVEGRGALHGLQQARAARYPGRKLG